jgi:predicted transcriptional regulator
MAKLTFSVDEATVRTLKATAERLKKSQSLVVREAVAEYAARSGRLTETERRRMLTALDAMIERPPTRPQSAVTREVRQIQRARRQGGRKRPAE